MQRGQLPLTLLAKLSLPTFIHHLCILRELIYLHLQRRHIKACVHVSHEMAKEIGGRWGKNL